MEYGFDTLPGGPAWDVIAANAFNLFVERWGVASETCNGGLKWQYHPGPAGWTVGLSFLSFRTIEKGQSQPLPTYISISPS